MKKTFQELHDETLIAKLGEGGNICDISIDKLRSPTMRKLHKGQCPVDKKEKDTAMRRAGKRAGLSRSDRDKLYNSVEEGTKDLPPHLQKLIKKIEKRQKDWNKQNPRAKIKTLVWNPETGKPDIEVEEGYQEISNLVDITQEVMGKMIKAMKKDDFRTVTKLYRELGKIIK